MVIQSVAFWGSNFGAMTLQTTYDMQPLKGPRLPEPHGAGLGAHEESPRVGLPPDPLGHPLQTVGNRTHIADAVVSGASLANKLAGACKRVCTRVVDSLIFCQRCMAIVT